jgi:beta-glucanase (GH16 family)
MVTLPVFFSLLAQTPHPLMMDWIRSIFEEWTHKPALSSPSQQASEQPVVSPPQSPVEPSLSSSSSQSKRAGRPKKRKKK